MKTYPTLIPFGRMHLIIEQTAIERISTEAELDAHAYQRALDQTRRYPFNASATACFGGGCKITGEET